MSRSLLHSSNRVVTPGVVRLSNQHISDWTGTWNWGNTKHQYFPSKNEITSWMSQSNTNEEIETIVSMPVFEEFPNYTYSILSPTEIKRFVSLALWGGSALLETASQQRTSPNTSPTRYTVNFYRDNENLGSWDKLFASDWRKDQPLDAREVALLRYLVRRQGIPDLTVGDIAFMRLRADNILHMMMSSYFHNTKYRNITHSSLYLKALDDVTDKWSKRLWVNTFLLYSTHDFKDEAVVKESVDMLATVAAKVDINTSLNLFISYIRAGITEPKAIINGIENDIDASLLLNF